MAKNFSHEVVKGGGVVRAVHNHGIRGLPHRFKARYPDGEGNRYYEKGRFVSIYFDSNPVTLAAAENTLRLDQEVLRYTSLKARSALDFVNLAREERNPYVQQVLEMEGIDVRAKKKKESKVAATRAMYEKDDPLGFRPKLS